MTNREAQAALRSVALIRGLIESADWEDEILMEQALQHSADIEASLRADAVVTTEGPIPIPVMSPRINILSI